MKEERFIDTNIFIRHLTNDDPRKSPACFALFKQAAKGDILLTTSESVIAEVVYVLQSTKHYGLSRQETRDRLYPILSIRGLRLPDRKQCLRALELYAEHQIDFEDCLTVAHMSQRNVKMLYSYDTDFDRFMSIKRIEPENGGKREGG